MRFTKADSSHSTTLGRNARRRHGRFGDALRSLAADGYLEPPTEDIVSLTRAGLLRVDSLLKRFFLPEHAGIRYT